VFGSIMADPQDLVVIGDSIDAFVPDWPALEPYLDDLAREGMPFMVKMQHCSPLSFR